MGVERTEDRIGNGVDGPIGACIGGRVAGSGDRRVGDRVAGRVGGQPRGDRSAHTDLTTKSRSIDVTDVRASAAAVVATLRDVTTVPNWALTRNVGAESVVLVSSAATVLRNGRVLDRRRHHEVLSAELFESDGRPFGRLVGYVTDRDLEAVSGDSAVLGAVRERAARHVRTVDVFASLLSGALERDRLRADQSRDLERNDRAPVDPITGLFAEADWNRLVATEGARCRVLDDPAIVLTVRIDEIDALAAHRGSEHANDARREVAFALRSVGTSVDAAARVVAHVGDEFRVLLLSRDPLAELEGIRAALRSLPFAVTPSVAARASGDVDLSTAIGQLAACPT
jgi:GGDEF domain-containing protein